MAIEDKIREIRTSISQAQGKKARAQVEYDNAVERRNSAKKSLKEDFGVETNDDAKRVLNELQTELDATVTKVEQSLAEAGA